MSYTDLQNNKTTLQSILDTVNALPSAGNGLNTSDATITPETVFLNETGYANGQKVTGTFTIEDEVTAQENLISQIASALEGKTSGGVNVETCTVTISTDDGDLKWITYSSVQDGQIIYNTIETLQNGNSITLDNIVKNSIITLYYTGDSVGASTCGGGAIFDYNRYQGRMISHSGEITYVSGLEDGW